MNKIFEQDIENITKNFDMSIFYGKTILITGATGLIGKLCAKSLLKGTNTKVIALVRNIEKAKKIFETNSNLEFLVQDINNNINLEQEVDYIIHTASVTSSADFVQKPVETILTAIEGTKNVLEFAKKQNKLKGMVYLSSLEVYGTQSKENIKESDYGFIDILTLRSSYSESKKLVETLCISYGNEYNIPVKIARLSQTFGAGVEKNDNRVFAQFCKSVINKENIILHTKGETKRNYCYTTDAVRGIFTILAKGENNQAYNIANKNTYISISDMAKSLENKNTKVVFEIDNKDRGFNPTVKICLNTEKLESLGWSAELDLPQMFERTIKSMREENEQN